MAKLEFFSEILTNILIQRMALLSLKYKIAPNKIKYNDQCK